MYYAPNTVFTDIKPGATRHKSHSTARFLTTQDLNAVSSASRLHTSSDLDATVFSNIMKVREERGEFTCNEEYMPNLEYGHDNPLLIPESRASNCVSEAGRELTEDECKPHEQIEDRLFDVLTHTDVLQVLCPAMHSHYAPLSHTHTHSDCLGEQGVDPGGAPKKIRIDIIIIRMTVPGGDAGLLLNCLRNSMPGIVLPLTNILSHMALCLRVAGSGVNLNEVFSPGCKNNISMLTAEAQLLPAVFNVAMRNEIHNIVFRGVVYNPRSPREVRVYAGMLEGVLASRHKHFKIVNSGCNRDTKPTFKKQDTPMLGFGECVRDCVCMYLRCGACR